MTNEFEILSVKAREVLDSRGNPTVEVEVKTKNGISRAMVPSGASKGKHEALELRDNDDRFLGMGVRRAVENVNDIIAKNIIGMDCREQGEIDELMIELDGTENKSNLGANAILGVSMAILRASALEMNIPLYKRIAEIVGNGTFILPTPAMNIINGGKHAGNDLKIQEFMIMPTGANSLGEGIRICSEIYHTLKETIKKRYGKNAINVGDEGGFAPPLNKTEDAIGLILKSIHELGYEDDISLAIDAAASEFYSNGRYILDGSEMDRNDMIGFYSDLISNYPIISVEDIFSQDDWDSWIEFTTEFGKKVQIVGDDLLVTNIKRIKRAVKSNACNALLLKINQIGTITESIEAAKYSLKSEWNVMVSHRSGETEDPFIADLVVGLGTGQIKSGAPCRSERNAKYNQLLRIEEELKEEGKAEYMGNIL
ncbi:MAG TPA: phosphopyruvate hydratase [Candidatus Altiarchaeales archaeon]|nr:phosphopyruvate hydratase [Candidatus Altiarchaeales archaeon]HEX54590.1 phosphopyruvate hydratase [Candidatus Altiarchaeales archaeon]